MVNSSYVSRQELLDFLNHLLNLKLKKIEETSSGAIACQVIEILFPNSIPLQKVDWEAKLDYQIEGNYRLLQTAFSKHDIERTLDIGKLCKGSYKDLLDFNQWLKTFCEQNGNPSVSPQRSREMRVKAKGGVRFNKRFEATTDVSRRMNEEQAESSVVSEFEALLEEQQDPTIQQPDNVPIHAQSSASSYRSGSPVSTHSTHHSVNNEKKLSSEEESRLLPPSFQDRMTPSRTRTCQSLPDRTRSTGSVAGSVFSRGRRRLLLQQKRSRSQSSVAKCLSLRWGIGFLLIFGLSGLTAYLGGLGNSDPMIYLQLLKGTAEKITSPPDSQARPNDQTQRKIEETQANSKEEKSMTFPEEKYKQFLRSVQEKMPQKKK